MVYKILNDGINGPIEKSDKRRRRRRKEGAHIKAPKLQIQTESKFASFLTKIIKFILLIYDILSFPIYFFIQRPDKRKKEAQRTRSERINTNTWIKTTPNPNDTNYLLNGLGWSYNLSQDSRLTNKPSLQHKYMGSTLNEIFANSIKKFSSKLCLGYRAVVTCPVLTLNEEGQRILQDKSFRSDYTWYTYEQVGRRVQDLASGLYMSSVLPGSRALFLANTSLEWFIAAQSCFQLSLQLVIAPGVNDISPLIDILKESKISIIFGSCDKLNLICSLFDCINLDKEEEKEEVDLNVNFDHLKTLIIIDWQFAIDFSEPIFVKLKKSSEGIVENVISMGEIEEIGVENPIELTCTKFLNEETSPSISSIEKVGSLKDSTGLVESKELVSSSSIKDYTFERYLEVATTHNNSCNSRSKEDIPNTVPMRRRSTMAKVSPRLDTNKSDRRPTTPTTTSVTTHRRTGDDYYINGGYTLTDNQEVDNKSSSPRLSISEQVKLSNDLSNLIIKPDDLAMIVYSLGSLGKLKAIMITHNYIARYNYYLFLDGLIRGEDIHCTTLPLDNLIEFITEICVFSHGGSIGYSFNQQTLFYDGNELFEKDMSDLEALNPSFLLAKPYDLERLRSSVQNYINLKLNPLKNFILTTVLYDYKKYWAKRHFETPIVDRIFCRELKNLFGSNLKYILCNGATDCFETKDFFTLLVNIPVIEIYGPDEAIVSLISVNDIWDYKRRKKNQIKSGYSFYSWKWGDQNDDDDDDDDNENDELDDFKNLKLMPPRVNKNIFREDKSKNLLITSSILCPTMGTRIKLEDWEDFRTSDYPYPRGRLVIGGDVVCKGYYNKNNNNNNQDKDKTISTTTTITNKEDGTFYIDSNFITWFRTDDIVRVFPNGSFEIISAISDIIKMVDGQFISLSQIESIVRNSQFVENVCAICGDNRKFVIALVVPNLRRLALKSPGEANLKMAIGMEPEPEELLDIEFRREVCNDRFLCEFVDEHLNELIAKQGFHSIPSKFYLVPEIWTPETELVTPSFEPKRSAIQKYYALDIQSIFKMRLNKSKNRLSGRLLKERKSSNPNKTDNTNHLTRNRLSH